MLSYIEGKLVQKTPAFVVIDVHGMGYQVNISLHTYTELKEKDHFRLFTHLAIKNEATTPVGFILYGFADEQERQLFRHLLSVSGIGHNTALLMLSSLSPEKIAQAILDNNTTLLQSVKGIGLKTAQRVIIDLRDKLHKGSGPAELLEPSCNNVREEALSGLVVLGFNKTLAEKALNKIIAAQGSLSVEQLLKEALKIL